MAFLNDTVVVIDIMLGQTTTFDSLIGFLYNLPERAPFVESLSLGYNDREWPEWRLVLTLRSTTL